MAEIPRSYVAEDELRLQLYRRIAGLTSQTEIDAMRQEILDRFGPAEERDGLPMPVGNLLYQIYVKILARS